MNKKQYFLFSMDTFNLKLTISYNINIVQSFMKHQEGDTHLTNELRGVRLIKRIHKVNVKYLSSNFRSA